MPHDTRHSFTVSCAGCGLTLLQTHPRSTRGPAWCSDQCRYQAQRLIYLDQAKRRDKKPVKPVERTCRICGVSFLGLPSRQLCSPGCRMTISCSFCGSGFLAQHPSARFCSASCRARAHKFRRPDLAAQYRATTRARQKKKPVERTCQICGVQFLGRQNANVCSSKCRNRRAYLSGKATGSRRRNTKTWRAKQRAEGNGHKLNVWTESKKAAYQRRRALKAAAAAERFPNSEIFERDGWRCQLCGRKVDPALRYPSPMSSSIDHIVPLSVPGGPGHVRANVQLAHLGCNTKKSNGVAGSGEQLRLIG